jgi:hypothetical protein|tara:strand:+ start:212 stop:466 length:255 start_codon:yes stop_codon:yes gene_type:complete
MHSRKSFILIRKEKMNKEDNVSWLVGAKNAFDDGMKDGMNNKPKKNGEEVWPIHHVAYYEGYDIGYGLREEDWMAMAEKPDNLK